MTNIQTFSGMIFLSLCAVACSQGTVADVPPANAPVIQTLAPIIFLKDNLDEKDKLGWCIDTKGREFTEKLHAHSCKPAGDDVLFSYDSVSGQIESATYPNKCAQILAEGADVDFGLLDCDGQNPAQQFDYDVETSELHPRGKNNQCMAAGAASAAAGPYMSRSLDLVSCKEVAPALKQWAILSE